MSHDPLVYDQVLFEKLRNSELFATYQDAFRSATGLPLRLVNPNFEEWCLNDDGVNGNKFCDKLNICKTACTECIQTNQRLLETAAVEGPTTCHCFAGLAATAVPVRTGSTLIGFLKTGQVFNQVPKLDAFLQVSRTLMRYGLRKNEVETLKIAYAQTHQVEPERYRSMITLLATFAEHLGDQAEKLMVVRDGSEPAGISKARDFIQKNLAEPLSLAAVARQAGLSESHFCRVFREVTGLTLTDYINRRRIEWAKRELLKAETRISEIAFLVGYQSLSQFNRSFARVTGRSPSRYRTEELTQLAS